MATATAQERTGEMTFRGKPVTLLGPSLTTGQPAPDFELAAADLATATLDTVTDGGKRAALLIVVPSLDTKVCHIETKKFNSRLAELAGVATYVVSMDLPFAQSRWCGAEGVSEIATLSDYQTHDFGYNYGLRIKELGLLGRANIVIGKDKTIKYLEVVPEVAAEPDYDATIAAAKAAA